MSATDIVALAAAIIILGLFSVGIKEALTEEDEDYERLYDKQDRL